ncbi:uncharacterized protein LOC130635255 isoform X2 [Hydractinia symbiolongicarpus]|uniref:uncharacterized protein LOC130635255 isoform X2 n=1 Tax=Hydractinia symbiolongicarpus TaxID=13093 RepID=UPI00254F984F|nr:uncharacterized protein LOC130635255 isoform X2 [Hydractinia symbiolongicarpus]
MSGTITLTQRQPDPSENEEYKKINEVTGTAVRSRRNGCQDTDDLAEVDGGKKVYVDGQEDQGSPCNGQCDIANLTEKFSSISLTKDEEKKTVDSLKLSKLVNIMNKSPYKSGIIQVACQFSLSKEEMVNLSLNAAGGGKPALTFLNELSVQKSSESIYRLITCCKEVPALTGAVTVLESLDPSIKTIGDLLPMHLDDLADKLQREGSSKLPDYKYIAEEFNMQEHIPMYEASVRTENSYCPTRTRGCRQTN